MDTKTLSDSLWSALVEDIVGDPDNFPQKRPLLAHYTSIEVFESIVKNEEIWFSNPLFMNDLQEIRFGVYEGRNQFLNSQMIYDACQSEERYKVLIEAFEQLFLNFNTKNAMDIYAFCLSEHHPNDHLDGKLSMWRGYGGNGKGAAIVFDTQQLNAVEGSPFIVSRVHYRSSEDALHFMSQKISRVATFLRSNSVPTENLYIIAFLFLERIKLAALFSKHKGFSEENEWRIVYLKERNKNGNFKPNFDHIITNKGVEPKLKYAIKPIKGLTADDLCLDKIVNKVILGPMLSNDLAKESILMMLDNLQRPGLKDKVISSTIPYRS